MLSLASLSCPDGGEPEGVTVAESEVVELLLMATPELLLASSLPPSCRFISFSSLVFSSELGEQLDMVEKYEKIEELSGVVAVEVGVKESEAVDGVLAWGRDDMGVMLCTEDVETVMLGALTGPGASKVCVSHVVESGSGASSGVWVLVFEEYIKSPLPVDESFLVARGR